jgi:hypothetical protein
MVAGNDSFRSGKTFSVTVQIKKRKRGNPMKSQFHFKNVEADDDLKSTAHLALSKILDRAPCDSTAVALLEKQENGYRCSLDIYSLQGPFMASTVRPTALGAIYAVEEKLRNQIEFLWSHREKPQQTIFRNNFLKEVS